MAALVDPGMPIPARAIAIHGIGDEDLAGAPSFGEVAPPSSPSPRAPFIVAHNARFDLSFLDAELAPAWALHPAPFGLRGHGRLEPPRLPRPSELPARGHRLGPRYRLRLGPSGPRRR